MFKEGRELEDEHRIGSPTTARTDTQVAKVAPPDFFLFPRMKRELKGNRFDSIEAVQAATTKALNSIPETDFQRAFDEWQTRRTKCMGAGGMYFEDH